MHAKLAASLFGGTCFLCRGAARAPLCAGCDADLPRLAAPRCPRCALESPAGEPCGRCLAQAPHYEATVAALAYRFPADALVHALKFRGELALAALFGKMLLQKIPSDEAVDCVIPVPLSTARLRQRGYNQALEIARHVQPAKIDVSACVRQGNAPPQTGLPLEERHRNVHGAFRCTRSLAGARVAVLDDVMTTGATLDEIAATLKKAGASRVVNWVVARTFADD